MWQSAVTSVFTSTAGQGGKPTAGWYVGRNTINEEKSSWIQISRCHKDILLSDSDWREERLRFAFWASFFFETRRYKVNKFSIVYNSAATKNQYAAFNKTVNVPMYLQLCVKTTRSDEYYCLHRGLFSITVRSSAAGKWTAHEARTFSHLTLWVKDLFAPSFRDVASVNFFGCFMMSYWRDHFMFMFVNSHYTLTVKQWFLPFVFLLVSEMTWQTQQSAPLCVVSEMPKWTLTSWQWVLTSSHRAKQAHALPLTTSHFIRCSSAHGWV